MTFTKRPLAAGATLGDRLRSLRMDAGWSVEEVGHRIQIAPKYLIAIEESRYRDLPGLVYARQFVRQYALALETDVDMASGLLEEEYAIVSKTGPAARPLLTPRATTEFPWLRKHLRLLVAGAVVIVVVAYLGVQAGQNFLPPDLTVAQPAGDISTKALTITVSGTTDPQASVTINDQDVQTTRAGVFKETVDLHVGLNTLNISATKKHSHARVVTRHVLVEAPTGAS